MYGGGARRTGDPRRFVLRSRGGAARERLGYLVAQPVAPAVIDGGG